MRKKKLDREQALQKLKHYCRYQERCGQEVKKKLFELGVDRREHPAMIKELMDGNYFDEQRFAQAFVSGRLKMKQWGRQKIRYELREKKLGEQFIQKAMELIDDNEYRMMLQKLARKKYFALKHETAPLRKKKTMNYLVQKGFEAALCYSLVEEITNSANFGL